MLQLEDARCARQGPWLPALQLAWFSCSLKERCRSLAEPSRSLFRFRPAALPTAWQGCLETKLAERADRRSWSKVVLGRAEGSALKRWRGSHPTGEPY